MKQNEGLPPIFCSPPSLLTPLADRIVHIPCPIRQQILNPFQADGQGQAGRDDQPERMSGKSEAPERGQGHKHQGVREVIEANPLFKKVIQPSRK